MNINFFAPVKNLNIFRLINFSVEKSIISDPRIIITDPERAVFEGIGLIIFLSLAFLFFLFIWFIISLFLDRDSRFNNPEFRESLLFFAVFGVAGILITPIIAFLIY